MTDLLTEPCQTQRSALQTRKVSSRELLAATFARIDAIHTRSGQAIPCDALICATGSDPIASPYAPIDGAHRFIEARRQKHH